MSCVRQRACSDAPVCHAKKTPLIRTTFSSVPIWRVTRATENATRITEAAVTVISIRGSCRGSQTFCRLIRCYPQTKGDATNERHFRGFRPHFLSDRYHIPAQNGGARLEYSVETACVGSASASLIRYFVTRRNTPPSINFRCDHFV